MLLLLLGQLMMNAGVRNLQVLFLEAGLSISQRQEKKRRDCLPLLFNIGL